MQKSLKLVLLITIALLNCSISWSRNENNTILSTGELINPTDSVLISFNDLRTANAKMVELKYEKEVNASLRTIIDNNNQIMREYDRNIDALEKQIKQVKRQRNVARWGGVAIAVSAFIAIIVK